MSIVKGQQFLFIEPTLWRAKPVCKGRRQTEQRLMRPDPVYLRLWRSQVVLC